MIPQRKLTRTGFSNGINNRVDACRRRLRTVRTGTGEVQTRLEEGAAALELEAPGMNREVATITISMMETQERDEAGIT